MKPKAFAVLLTFAFLPPVSVLGQRISRPLPDDVYAQFDSACASQLSTMQNAWGALGMNGPVSGSFIEEAWRMDAAALREHINNIQITTSMYSPRRNLTELEYVTNVWQDCVFNTRAVQLGVTERLSTPRPPAPPPPPPPPAPPDPPAPPPEALCPDGSPQRVAGPGALATANDGEEEWLLADGRACVIIRTGQERVPNQPGYYNQNVTAINRCDTPLTTQACLPSGECQDMTVPAGCEVTLLVGTSQGVDDDFTMTSRDPRSGNTPPNRSPNGGNDNSPIDFGDDSGPYPRDGECEDPRFSGEGMAFDQYLSDDNVFRDATDCRNLLAAGRIEFTGYRDRNIVTIDDDQYDFGDDNGAWPRDGECDDPRFSGPGMAAESSLSEDNYFHDATDCRNALAAGTIEFSGYRDLDRGGGGNGANDTQGRSGGFWNGLFNVLNSALDAYTTYQEGVNASQGGDSGGSDSDGGGGDSGCGLTAADRAEGRVCTAN